MERRHIETGETQGSMTAGGLVEAPGEGAPSPRGGGTPSASAYTPRWIWTLIALVSILLLTAGLRIAWIAHANVNPLDGRLDDTLFYYGVSQSLSKNFAYRTVMGEITAHWPPGYPATLAFVFAIFGEGLWQAKLLNVLVATWTGALTFALGARAFGLRAGLLAALLVALFPVQVIFSTLIMTEVLFGFVFLLFTLLLLTWTLDRKDAAAWQLVVLGMLAGYASLIRSEAVMLPMAAAVLWKFAWPGWRVPIRHAAFCFAGVVLMLAPWTIRNAVQFHEFIPLRSDPGGHLSIAFERNYQDRTDRFVNRAIPFDETAGYMARHPWEIIPLQVDKLRYLYHSDSDGITWTQAQRPTLSKKEADRWIDVSDAYFFAMLGLAVGGLPLWILRPKQPARLAVGFALVGWTAIEIVSWPFTRYHFAVQPVLCIFAAGLLVALVGALPKVRTALSGRPASPGNADGSGRAPPAGAPGARPVMVADDASVRGQRYRIYRYSLMAALAAAPFVAATAIGMGVADRLQGDDRTSHVRLVSDGSTVPDALSTLTRSKDGADFVFSTSGLPSGHVVTLKAVIFNAPKNCKHGAGRLRCGEDDLSAPEAEGSIVFLTAASLRQAVSVVNFQGRLAADDKSRAFIGDGLTNPRGADVHLVLLDHGPPLSGLYGEMLSTLAAGCKNAPPGAGTPGPNACLDLQIAAHEK